MEKKHFSEIFVISGFYITKKFINKYSEKNSMHSVINIISWYDTFLLMIYFFLFKKHNALGYKKKFSFGHTRSNQN